MSRDFGTDVQTQVEECRLVLERKKTEFLKLFGIDQFGVGLKMRKGRFLPEVTLVFIVRRKLPVSTLKELKMEVVPGTIDDVTTDVIEVPYGFEARQNDDRWRPFLGGDAGIHYQVRATGTFGITTVNQSTGDYETLTNNHVGANEDIEGFDFAHKGDAWIQPGVHGGGTYPQDKVCELERWKKIIPRTLIPSRCPIGRGGESLQPGNWLAAALGRQGRYRYVTPSSNRKNLVDAAVGRVVNKSDATPHEVRSIGRVAGWKNPSLNDRVTKMGRTSLVTRGTVIITNLNVTVRYRGFEADFENQVAIANDGGPFSQPGDSGSLIQAADPESGSNERKALALLFAGGRTIDGTDITIANPIQFVIREVGYDL